MASVSEAASASRMTSPSIDLLLDDIALAHSQSDDVLKVTLCAHGENQSAELVVPSVGSTPTVSLRLRQIPHDDATRFVWLLLFSFVAKGQDDAPELNVEVTAVEGFPVLESVLALGGVQAGTTSTYRVTRSALFELFRHSFPSFNALSFPYVPSITNSLSHPLRPPKPPTGTRVYSRFVPHLQAYFNLNALDPSDVDVLHTWLNDPRVDQFWMEKGDLEQHRKFVQERIDDQHTLAVVGGFVSQDSAAEQKKKKASTVTEEKATFSEIYWVAEDRLAPLMKKIGNPARDYDRGVHVLVGSNTHRGPHRVRAWLPSLCHYCFLDEPRTERIVAEPNQKNAKMLKYFESVGFVREGTVEFPHKTSALMVLHKRHFYELCPF